MRNLNKKGFTLVELLAVIVVLAIVMSLAVVSITSVVDDTRRKGFVSDAKSFLDGAHQLVTSSSSDIFGSTTTGFAPQCKKGGDDRYIPLSAINLDRGGINSPYNNPYKKGEGTAAKTQLSDVSSASYIHVKTVVDDTTLACEYRYYIYLTDGNYAIGTASNAVPEIKYSNESTPEPLSNKSVQLEGGE